MTYSRGLNVKPKTKPLTDFYDLGDELGRGTQGVTYHAVERLSGDFSFYYTIYRKIMRQKKCDVQLLSISILVTLHYYELCEFGSIFYDLKIVLF